MTPIGDPLLRVGRVVFGRYSLRKLVGRGGMGVVWMARDESLERMVALKFLPEVLFLDAAARDDLKRETRRSLELTHPHIVRIHDFIEDEEMAAIAMEYVDGPTLSELRVGQASRCFEPDDLAVWVGALCAALDYAHLAARCVHRDLKPGNLMVNARGALKVADFGISCSLQNTAARVSAWASTGGTLGYMSPQQLLGELASPSDDIYSVGATLYEMLTGKPPFHSGDLSSQIRGVVPESIAERRRKFGLPNPPVPEVWEQTIAACLAKEPHQRPASAGEIARRLGLECGPLAESTPILGDDLPPTIVSAPTLAVPHHVLIPPIERRSKWSDPFVRFRWPIASAFLLATAILPWIANRRPGKMEDLAAPFAPAISAAPAPGAPVHVAPVFPVPSLPPSATSPVLPPSPDRAALLAPIPAPPEPPVAPAPAAPFGTVAEPAPANPSTQVQIETTPSGVPFKILASAYETSLAEVLRTGETPMTVRELPPGAYRIVFSPLGAAPRSANLQIPAEGPAVFQQEFPHGVLKLRSQPEGAELICDGQVIGQAPLDWPVLPGRHEVSARSNGRDARVRSVQVADATTQSIAFDFRSGGGGSSSTNRSRRPKKVEEDSVITKVGRTFKNLFGVDKKK